MPAIVMTIIVWICSSVIARCLLGAGLGLFTYDAIQTAFNKFEQMMLQQTSQLPAEVLSLASMLGIDYYLSVVLGALSCATFIVVAKVFVGKG